MKEGSFPFVPNSEQSLNKSFERMRLADDRIGHHRLPLFNFAASFLFILLLHFFPLFLLILQIIYKMLQIDKLIPLEPIKDGGNFFIFQLFVVLVAVFHKILVV